MEGDSDLETNAVWCRRGGLDLWLWWVEVIVVRESAEGIHSYSTRFLTRRTHPSAVFPSSMNVVSTRLRGLGELSSSRRLPRRS